MSNALSAQLIANATVAEYIHEISVRHRSRGPEAPRPASRRRRAARGPSAKGSKRLQPLDRGLSLVPGG